MLLYKLRTIADDGHCVRGGAAVEVVELSSEMKVYYIAFFLELMGDSLYLLHI